jgi:nitrogen regulatory protein P-II 1
MKKIEAIIRPHKLDEVHSALLDGGFSSLTIIEGYGKQKGHKETYRGSEFNIDLVPNIKLELVCDEEKTEKAISIIISTAKTGEVGDGKIFVFPVEETIRIRTEETGSLAL